MRKIFIVFIIGLITLKSVAQNTPIYNFEPDVRIFTAYSFLNVGGYDHDWLKMDMIRVEIRKILDSTLQIDFKQEIKNYVKKTNLGWYECGAYTLNLNNAPDFKWICDKLRKHT